jgi:hypothetical protein
VPRKFNPRGSSKPNRGITHGIWTHHFGHAPQ